MEVLREKTGRLGHEGGSIQGTQDKGYLLTLREVFILITDHYIMTLSVCDGQMSTTS